MKSILVILFSLACLQYSCAQQNRRPKPRCLNPNQNAGICVSIFECRALMSVLQRKPLQSLDEEFLRDSKCPGGNGQGPHVCCTGDTGFQRRDVIKKYNFPQFSQPARPQVTQLSQQQPRPWSTRGGPPTVLTPLPLPAVNPFIAKGTSSAALIPQPPTCGAIKFANKVLGGVDADLNEFPWIVLLEYQRRSGQVTAECAGSLINRRYILTAAHCVKGAVLIKKGPLVSVRLGEHDTSQLVDCDQKMCAPKPITVGVEEIIPHEQYDDSAVDKTNDIALVRLDRDISSSDAVSPICLPSVVRTGQPEAGAALTVAGWGSTLTSGKSMVLQKLKVQIEDQANCQRKFQAKNVIVSDSQFCAGGRYAEDSCSGDSGGPLMHFRGGAWVLEGVVSFGYKCGLEGWPAVYTRVSNYDAWIRSNIRA